MVTQLTISSKCTKGDILSNQLYWFALISLFSGNANTQSSPQTSLAPHASRRGSKKNALDDLAFEEVMRGKRQTLGDGHFDESGVWIPALKSTLSEESLKELNRGDGSFGKSLQKAQGLFARKRRDGSEQDKVAPVVSKSGRFGNEKPIDVKGNLSFSSICDQRKWSGTSHYHIRTFLQQASFSKRGLVWKWDFMHLQIKLGFIWMVVHQASLWWRGLGKLWNDLSSLVFSAECTIGMVRGLTPLKHYGTMALWRYGAMALWHYGNKV